jgi:hypothetical protein
MRYEDFELHDGSYELKNGVVLRIWTQQDGQWGCAARDHSVFCRRDRNLSDPGEGPMPHIEAALIANTIDGLLEMEDHPTKGWRFHVGDAGERRIEAIMARSGRTKEDLAKMTKAELREFLGIDDE